MAVIEPFFHITYVLNPGAAFGLLANARWFFILAACVLLAAFFWYRRQLRRQPAPFYYGCVALLAGAMGNLIDRIRQGLVIDFLISASGPSSMSPISPLCSAWPA